jgi:transcriptional regulator with XRE-family HTH domain
MIIVNSETFRKVRHMKGLTMREMAGKLGISTSYVNAIEKGREPLREGIKRTLYEVFSLDAEKVAEIERDYDKYRS